MKEVPKIQYLMRRGGRYSIRMRVPQDLLEAYAPTKEICRALGTGDFKKAKSLLGLAKMKIEAEFERKRLERSRRQDEADRLSQLDLHTVTLLVLDWFEDQKKDRDRADVTPSENPLSEEEIREERKLEEWEARQEMPRLRQAGRRSYGQHHCAARVR